MFCLGRSGKCCHMSLAIKIVERRVKSGVGEIIDVLLVLVPWPLDA